MKLSRKQFIKSVETLQEMVEEQQRIESIIGVNFNGNLKWINNYYNLLIEVCELDGDDLHRNDLDWFCFSTNFGKEKGLTTIKEVETGRTWDIKNADMLYTLIMGFDEGV